MVGSPVRGFTEMVCDFGAALRKHPGVHEHNEIAPANKIKAAPLIVVQFLCQKDVMSKILHFGLEVAGPSRWLGRNRSRGLSRFSRRSPRKWDCPPWPVKGQTHCSARNGSKNAPLPGL